MLNVTEVIFFALKAVCYPLAPLYDSREHVRPPAHPFAPCRRAYMKTDS